MARTTARTQARDAAVKRQEAANAARTEYDIEELETLTRLDLAKHRRDEAGEALASAEREMAKEVEHLFEMGNSLERILILSGEPDKDAIKRLRKLSDSRHGPDAESRTSTGEPPRTTRQAEAHTAGSSHKQVRQSVPTTPASPESQGPRQQVR